MEKQYDAVIAGYTCVDLIPDFKRHAPGGNISTFLRPGKLTEIGGMDFVLGGVVPNTGLAMKKFGRRVYLNGLIGTDVIGQIADGRLKQYGVSEGMVKTEEADTAFSIVIAPPGVDRIFLESPGCNQIFGLESIDFETIKKSRLFHFGYPPLLRQFCLNNGQQLAQLFSEVQKTGVITSLDFSLPDPESESGKVNWPVILGKTLPHVDVFVPSLEELLQTMMPGKYAEIQSRLRNTEIIDRISPGLIKELGHRVISLGVKIVLIKMGHRGAYLLTGDISSLNKKAGVTLDKKKWNNREILCNAYKVDKSQVKNATGAGDTAVAAFLTAVLDGEFPETAIRYAAMAGRESLYCENIFEDIDNWEQLTEKIQTEQNELIC
ncbi:MAG: carbohydrate kinase family protein [Prolixibacteraceae bacterium]|nr:carbohydrate kinase family protein [Prolixibacteraceae bacterium]